jgi:hypothetical protein
MYSFGHDVRWRWSSVTQLPPGPLDQTGTGCISPSISRCVLQCVVCRLQTRYTQDNMASLAISSLLQAPPSSVSQRHQHTRTSCGRAPTRVTRLAVRTLPSTLLTTQGIQNQIMAVRTRANCGRRYTAWCLLSSRPAGFVRSGSRCAAADESLQQADKTACLSSGAQPRPAVTHLPTRAMPIHLHAP